MTKILASVTGLTVTFPGQSRPAVDAVNLTVAAGECVALVGESGSGKSLTARAFLGLLPTTATVTGHIQVTDAQGRLITAPPPRTHAWTAIRGVHSSLIPQDALGALDPLRRIELEVGDALRLHRIASGSDRRKRVINALREAGMPEPERRLTQRSDELSGGMRQRALVASALIAAPEFIVADEPTTALDAGHRGRVLTELRRRVNGGAGMLLITHDLESVRGIADRVLVMQNGKLVEAGSPEGVLESPTHVFTRELLNASPAGKKRADRYVDRSGTPGLSASNITMSFGRGSNRRTVLSDVGLNVYAGETVGLVGESGSGKTTLLRILLGLLPPDSGAVEIGGVLRTQASARVRRELRRKVSFVSQDPLDSFPPGATARAILVDALRANGTPRPARAARAQALADEVRITSKELTRPVSTLSGGQRQRVSIARALARDPQLLILDEPVSALDLTVQSRVLELLNELQERRNTAFLLVSHDTEVIRFMSDRVLRIAQGRIHSE